MSLFHTWRSNPALRLKASLEAPGLTEKITSNKQKSIAVAQNESALFSEMKHRFLSFKKNKYMENLECFQNLAKGQAPKHPRISARRSLCSPQCGNLVPPFESGPSETNAALEFAVNALEVANILVIGHSCCGGIRALMSMQDEENSRSFIKSWVAVGMHARLSTKAAASNLSFDQQCRHCEKESINRSMLNLLTYQWIAERVTNGLLSIHGGYYDFIDCTFEKWTLNYHGSSSKEENGRYPIINREFWC
ncbi:unnamed protein product [Ilex paraguariensis]|uniref:Carbonic anhydrase n=1 Tax=Ilex paraguariensis TaxID=185542 RepID=A0ABC8U8Q7_9AQUA